MNEPPHLLPESEFCQKTGLDPALVAELRSRSLIEGQHFEKKGARCLLSVEGVKTLLAGAGAFVEALEQLRALFETMPASALVIRRLCGNRQLVLAGVEQLAVTVRVPAQYLWRIGQTIEVLPPLTPGAHWRLASIPKKQPRR